MSENEKLSIPIVIGSLVIVIILGFMLVKSKIPQTKVLPTVAENTVAPSAQNSAPAEPTFDPTTIPPITDKDYVKGSANATVSIILYSDSQCPYCRMFYPTLKNFLSQNSDVRLVYRPTPFHEAGKIEEQAMDCANDQGKYWEYLDALYTSTDTSNVTDVARLKKIATDVGLDGAKLEQCFTSQKYAGNIDAYLNAARGAKISGTPTSILIGPNGTKQLIGASSADALKTAVDLVR
jgi:protein-disulfide isomerase